MKCNSVLLFLFLFLPLNAFAGNFEITKIEPIFNDQTPGFGEFEVKVGVRNNTDSNEKLVVSCYYTGFTNPGVYFKNEPMITKQYKIINLKPKESGKLIFEKDFIAYHPETLGEIIVSIAGKSVVSSIRLKTRFHPKSQD